MMEALGIYLQGGGTPDGFDRMTLDDIQIMWSSYKANKAKDRSDMLEGIATVVSKLFGGTDGGI